MSDRNRAQGWQHAKKSGHSNEKLVADLISNSTEIQSRLLQCAHRSNVSITTVSYGGINEKDVPCILGGKTKSKTDLCLFLSDGSKLNISLKKESGGQVFLIGIDRFISGYEQQYHTMIPNDVKQALSLYFGSATNIPDIIQEFSISHKALETRKHRLVGEALKAYNELLYDELLLWFNKNIKNLFDFCFSKGLAMQNTDWADIIWYKNLIGENELDEMFYIADIQKELPSNAAYGFRNGGSTIQLPFGFVQWHSPRKVIPGSIQFHHSFDKIKSIAKQA